MLPNELSLTKFLSLFQIPITPLLIKTLSVSILIFIILRLTKNRLGKFRYLLSAILLILFIVYFGLKTTLIFFITVLGSLMLGRKIFKHNSIIFSFTSGFFILLEIYIVAAIFAGFSAALFLIFVIFGVLFFNNKKMNRVLFEDWKSQIIDYLYKFNVLDIWLIILSFVIGSLPQSHWDAIHANLYNAKWYVINNSFKPLTESISSLFPQNAIGYYSFFYQIGTEKALQLGYILPLLIIISVFKKIFVKTNLIWYLFLFTPIVIFQASNGYYDLLLTSLLITAIYLLFLSEDKNLFRNTITSSVLIGFASAIKFFPLVFFLLPGINYLFFKLKNSSKNWFVPLLSIVIIFLPITIWLIRAYVYTGSPVFPFFQSFFPTPKLWSGADLVDNFMIQTAMKTSEWIKGGFLLYPLLSYFKTESYIEATRGYPGIIYILLLPLQLLILINIFKKLLIRKVDKKDFFYLYIFGSYFIVGLVSRYYRYLWPFQLILALITILYISNSLIKLKRNFIFTIGIFIIILININNVVGYFRFFPIITSNLFKPNYNKAVSKEKNPITYLNGITRNHHDITILDSSKFILPRFHFSGKTYECNWYWINGVKEIALVKKLDNKFNYIITSNPINISNDYCHEIIGLNKNKLQLIYKDNNYFIFKTNEKDSN